MSVENKPERKGKDSSGGITAISVRGYKSLAEECSLEIRPLTVLAGANSSGKSSALQPLLMLKQTLEANYDPGGLRIVGPNVRFTSAEQFLTKLPGRRTDPAFTVSLELNNEQSLALIFEQLSAGNVDVIEMQFRGDKDAFTLRSGMSHRDIESALPKALQDYLKHTFLIEEGEKFSWKVERGRFFLGLTVEFSHERKWRTAADIYLPFRLFARPIREVIHVPGLRGNPERTYKRTAVGNDFPGTFENYVASVITHWQATGDKRLADLGSHLEELGLTWKVDAKQVDDTQVEIRIGRLHHGLRGGAKDLVSIADVGFGVSQTLPVLVALLAAEPGQLVYLEQPEIHLHPKAQVALAGILAHAANRGVRVVAETHSSLLLLGIQRLVAQADIDPGKVKLHWFKRRQDGVTEVSSADLDQAGAYGDWPEDFGEVALNAESSFLDAAESHQGIK